MSADDLMDFHTGWQYIASVSIRDRTETIADQFEGPDDVARAELIALYLAGDLVREVRGSLIGVSIKLQKVEPE